MELKHMNVDFQVKEYREEDEYFSFSGYGSTSGNVDLGNDRVMTGAFKRCIEDMQRQGKKLPVLWQHDMTMPLGTYVEMYEDEKGLFVKGRMPKADDFVRGRVIPQMKAGSINSMSIGYVAKQWDMDGDIRNLKEIILYEVSLVTMPMNPQAVVTDMKSAVPYQDLPLADEGTPWDRYEADSRVRDFTGSYEYATDSYRKAFLWMDSQADEELYGSYKLPIADIINDEMRAVPRAIFAAAAAIQGARGGVNIPEADKEAIKRNIERYYSKMDRESPFDGKTLVVHKEMLDALSERDIDSMLRSGVRVTRSAAKKILSCLNVEGLRDAGTKDVARDAENDTSDKAMELVEKAIKILQE